MCLLCLCAFVPELNIYAFRTVNLPAVDVAPKLLYRNVSGFISRLWLGNISLSENKVTVVAVYGRNIIGVFDYFVVCLSCSRGVFRLGERYVYVFVSLEVRM